VEIDQIDAVTSLFEAADGGPGGGVGKPVGTGVGDHHE
jgi:hypothetical protein